MPFSRKHHLRHRCRDASDAGDYLVMLHDWRPFARLDSKLSRALKQDEPVHYGHILPGLDVLFCGMRGAVLPYPSIDDLRTRCMDCIVHALEQPFEGLRTGGYWYEAQGFACLVFASVGRESVLADFGMTMG